MRNFIAFIRDHSVSMTPIARYAARDYNANIMSVRENSLRNNQDTLVTVVECSVGYSASNRVIISNAGVSVLKPIAEGSYKTDGGSTPLFDAVGLAINELKRTPTNDPDTSYLVLVTTDGEDNSSRTQNGDTLGSLIRDLTATDRWTFVFRVPVGKKYKLVRLGIPEGNIIEWEGTQQGVETAQAQTVDAFGQYFTMRSAGVGSTQKFYANTENLSTAQVEQKMLDISHGVMFWPVTGKERQLAIKPFIENRFKGSFKKGAAFYQLTKTEEVQAYKQIIIRDKVSKAVYGGDGARSLLGLPTSTKIKLAPDKLGKYDIFVQSTSVNRKLVPGTEVLYFEAASF